MRNLVVIPHVCYPPSEGARIPYDSALGLGAREKQLYNAIDMDYQTESQPSPRALATEYLGRQVHFELTTLPRADCFFLNERHLSSLIGKENFGRLDRMCDAPL